MSFFFLLRAEKSGALGLMAVTDDNGGGIGIPVPGDNGNALLRGAGMALSCSGHPVLEPGWMVPG